MMEFIHDGCGGVINAQSLECGRCLKPVRRSAEIRTRDPDARYLILATNDGGDAACWWRPDGHGYTTNPDEAGRWDADGAKRIQLNRSSDVAIPEAFVNTLARVIPSSSLSSFLANKNMRLK